MRNRVTRRRTLASLGAAGIAGLAGCAGGDGGTETDGGSDTRADTETDSDMDGTTTGEAGYVSGTVTIGVLQPVSGDLQYYGQQALWGFSSGLGYKAGAEPSVSAETGSQTVTVGDVDCELLIRDTQFSADTAQSLATNLVTDEDVDMLFGCTSSGAAVRVAETVAKQAEVPFVMGPAASASATAESSTCGEQIFRASENTAMDARSGGRYVARESDVSRVYLFGADYSFGRAVVDNYEDVLTDEGVEIVGKRFVPRGYSEWEGLLDNAEEAGAEGIVGGFTVATLPNLFTSYLNGDYSYTVFGGFATEITNNVVGGLLRNQLGEPLTREKLDGAGIGPFTTRYHWNQYDNEINSAFVDGYVNAYGKVPDLFTSGTFTAASAIVQGVEESGSTEGADVASAMRGMTVTDSPKGTDAYTFQEYNNQARSEMTVANVAPTADEWSESWDAPVQPSDPVARIAAEDTTVPTDSDAMGCSL